MKQHQHYHELTVMSGIAILFVLAIHGCGSALNGFYPSSATYADTDLWLRTFSNFAAPAVPMFLFISGFKYAANDAQTPYFTFLKKRLPRVLMSFAIINTLFWALDSIKYMETFDLILLVKTYIHSWVGYSVAYQLWYIPMYCCVIALCPLVRKQISSTVGRFCMFAVIGVIQRILEPDIPLLATYPIRFISYPIFFELGVLAQEYDWRNKISAATTTLWGCAYLILVVFLSWAVPVLSVNDLTKYIVFYFLGTIIMFMVSVVLQKCRMLYWLGVISYPVFLLHEPLLGKLCTLLLSRMNMHSESFYLLVWVLLDLAATVLVVYLVKIIQFDGILWNYKFQSSTPTKESI